MGHPRTPGLALVLATVGTAPLGTGQEPHRPNVLFISVDDLNDWIEPLGGHPQARTPNLSRLANRSVTFTRAYTPSPGCNPTGPPWSDTGSKSTRLESPAAISSGTSAVKPWKRSSIVG